MSQKRGLTLTISNGSHGRMAAANSVASPGDAQPLAPDARLKARAGLAATYAGLLGVEAAESDLTETMRAAAPETAEDTLLAGLRSIGLIADVVGLERPDAQAWPALAQMTS